MAKTFKDFDVLGDPIDLSNIKIVGWKEGKDGSPDSEVQFDASLINTLSVYTQYPIQGDGTEGNPVAIDEYALAFAKEVIEEDKVVNIPENSQYIIADSITLESGAVLDLTKPNSSLKIVGTALEPNYQSGSVTANGDLSYILLDGNYSILFYVSVGRILVHRGLDYNVSTEGGVTKIAWIGSLAPSGDEAIEEGDQIFYFGIKVNP